MEIGDILFNITFPDAINFDKPDDAYVKFLKKSRHHEKEINIEVSLDINDKPQLRAEDKIFESESIRIYKNKGFIIALHAPDFNSVLRMAVMNKDRNQITVYLSDSMQLKHRGLGFFQNPLYYPIDQILLTLYLADNNGGLIHAAGIYINNRAFLFPGKSGAGKSTLCREFGDEGIFSLINDDRMLIRKQNNQFMAYGTPWPGENGYTQNTGFPLGGIFFINQHDENQIRPLSRQDAFEKLMPVISIPWYDSDLVSNYFSFCEGLLEQVSCYELSFKPDKTIANVFKEYLKII